MLRSFDWQPWEKIFARPLMVTICDVPAVG
jgi:hypothetical protein